MSKNIEDFKDTTEKINKSIDYVLSILPKDVGIMKDSEQHSFVIETYRVIILYIVSIVEVVLVAVYKSSNPGDFGFNLKYKHVSSLPEEYVYIEKSKIQKVVIAVQIKEKVDDNNLTIGFLLKYFKSNRVPIFDDNLIKDIEYLSNIRNTHHLTKKRSDDCKKEDVDLAFDILFRFIDIIKNNLS